MVRASGLGGFSRPFTSVVVGSFLPAVKESANTPLSVKNETFIEDMSSSFYLLPPATKKIYFLHISI